MKTNIILGIAAVALLFSSCSKNETDKNGQLLSNDPERIGFGINTGSRAADNNLATLETKGNFFIVALKNNNGTAKSYFNESYVLTGGKWDWTTTPTDATENLFNWPEAGAENYPMTFYSFYPQTNADEIKYDDVTGVKNIEILVENAIADQVDYLAAKTIVDAAPFNGRANFAFTHLLSKVLFKIQGTTEANVNIKSIRVVNVQNQASRTLNPRYNLVTGWVNPVINAGNNYVPYSYKVASEAVDVINTNDATVAGTSGALMLMPQYGTPIWVISDYLAAATAELKDVIYTKVADKFTPAALTQWNNNVFSKITGSYIEVVYNIENKDKTGYLVGGASQFIRVGYPLDLTVNAEKQCWASGKQYSYIISLGTGDATGGILLDPFYVNDSGTPTVDPIDNPATVKPGDPINTAGRIGLNLDVNGWVDAPVTIK